MLQKPLASMTLTEIYLDYFNNFLTIERFAAYYDLTQNDVIGLLQVAREEHEKLIDQRKTAIKIGE